MKKITIMKIMFVFLLISLTGCTEQNTDNDQQKAVKDNSIIEQGTIIFRSASNIYSINPDGSGENFLTTGLSPIFSPDGSKIAYFGGNYSSDLCVMNKGGTNQMTLADNIGNYYTWLPDSNRILYIDYDTNEEAYWYYIIDADGENKKKVFNDTSDSFYFSLDGEKMVSIEFELEPYTHGVLYIMNEDTSNKRKLVDDELDLEHYGLKMNLWSPDGSKIAYLDGERLYVVNTDGSNKLQIGSGTNFCWSPDGSKIAIWEYPNGLIVMNPDGSEKTVVEQLGSWVYGGPASWSPDGTRLVYSVGEARSIKVADLNTGESKEIAWGLNVDWA
jgi:Tol biopolymer transport system component